MNYWIDWVYSLSDQSFSFIYLQGQIDSNSSSLDENLVYCPWLVLTGFPQTVDSTLFKNSNVLVYILDQWIRRKWQYIGWEKRKRRFVLLSHWLRVRASPRSHNHDLPLIAEFYPTQTCQKAGFLFKCPVPTVLLKGENIIRIREFRRAN